MQHISICLHYCILWPMCCMHTTPCAAGWRGALPCKARLSIAACAVYGLSNLVFLCTFAALLPHRYTGVFACQIVLHASLCICAFHRTHRSARKKNQGRIGDDPDNFRPLGNADNVPLYLQTESNKRISNPRMSADDVMKLIKVLWAQWL